MIRLLSLISLLSPVTALSDTLVATQTLRPFVVIERHHISKSSGEFAGAIIDIEELIGYETLQIIYAGRPFLRDQIGKPSVIKKNDTVEIFLHKNSLSIVTQGRSLERAALGEKVRVTSNSSRKVLVGTVIAAGSVRIDVGNE